MEKYTFKREDEDQTKFCAQEVLQKAGVEAYNQYLGYCGKGLLINRLTIQHPTDQLFKINKHEILVTAPNLEPVTIVVK